MDVIEISPTLEIVGPSAAAIERMKLEFVDSAAGCCERALEALEAGDVERAAGWLAVARVAQAVAMGCRP